MNRGISRFVVLFSWGSVLGLLAVVFVFVGFLLDRGMAVWNMHLFFGEVSAWDAIINGQPVWNGIWSATVGTLQLVLLSAFMAVPIGVASGVYLAQYAHGAFKQFLSFVIDILAGIPSIVMGLFGFALILFLRKTLFPDANTSLLLAAGCIALLVLPYLVLTTQGALEGLPASVKLTGPSLGLTRWQNITHILLPASSRGILSGIVLSLGRAAEDTAVILLTGVVASAGLPSSLTDKFEALPFTVYYFSAEYQTAAELDWAFGAALTLLCLNMLLFAGAFFLQKAMEKRWKRYSKTI